MCTRKNKKDKECFSIKTFQISQINRGNLKMNRRNRVLMEGYGAYGIPLPTGFDIIKTCAMERGWVIAQALVRGGGDRGTGWHE